MTSLLSDVISLNRDSKKHVPEFRFPLVPTLDAAHCSVWERHLGEVASHWEQRKATPELWNQIPETSGLYMFVWKVPVGFDVEGKGMQYFRCLLYCGQAGANESSGTLRKRYKTEYSKYLKGDPSQLFATSTPSGRKEELSRWLLLEPLEYWWAEVSDKSQLAALEKELIRILAPPLNVQHKVLRPAVRRPAF